MIRSSLTRIARVLLTGVSKRVATDGLFEQPGERAPTERMAPPADKRASVLAASVGERPTSGAPARPAQSARPADGCVPVDLIGLKAALVPSGRPLVVNHWATWCDSCVDELPRLVRAAAGIGATADFIGVSWDLFDHPGVPTKVAAKVASVAASSGVGFASVLYTGTPAELFEACGLAAEVVPQTFVLTPDGAVAWHKEGILTDDDVFPLIAAVKAAGGST